MGASNRVFYAGECWKVKMNLRAEKKTGHEGIQSHQIHGTGIFTFITINLTQMNVVCYIPIP